MKTQDKSGSIMLVAITFMFIGFAAAAVSMRSALNEGRMVKSQIDVERSHYLAEAALELAAAEVTTFEGYIPYGEVVRKTDEPISLNGTDGTYSYVINKIGYREYRLKSEGNFNRVRRGINVERAYIPDMPNYALYTEDFKGLYYVPGDVVGGKVYSESEIWIWSSPVAGGPHFKEEVETGARRFMGLHHWAIFDKPPKFNVRKDKLNDFIDFDNEIKGEARHGGLVISGPTEVRFPVNTNTEAPGQEGDIWIRNSTHFGTNTWQAFSLQSLDLIYIEDDTNSGRPGTLTVEGGELDGTVTIYTDDDVTIKNSIRMRNDPRDDADHPNLPPSDDALGIVSKDDIWIDTNWMPIANPPDIELFGSFIAIGSREASPNADHFGNMGVLGHDNDSRGPRGTLRIHGSRTMEQGFPNGKFHRRSGTVLAGYNTESTFDERFIDNPPPFSPAVQGEIRIEGWRYERYQ